MIWRHSSEQRNRKAAEEERAPTNKMGQLSSSEAAAAVGKTALQSAVVGTAARAEGEARGAAGERPRATSLLRPSQPIDIRGSHHRLMAAHQRVVAALPPRLLQRSASEMCDPSQHQPRVIQPRRLTSTLNSACGSTSLAPDMNAYRERLWHRQSAASIPPLPVNPECPSSSGECRDNNKENGAAAGGYAASSVLSRSRKRLNSAELEYDGLECSFMEGQNVEDNGETVAAASEAVEMEQNEPEQVSNDSKREDNNSHIGSESEQQQQQRQRPISGGRREGGRIAYLYDVYGASDCEQLHCAPVVHQQRNAFADGQSQANILASHYWDDCCFLDDEEDELNGDEEEDLARTHCLLPTRLHTVSDIIGYAKVVRAQRNETLGRLNDVMSQFDALIRSYSMAMRSAKQRGEEEGSDSMDDGGRRDGHGGADGAAQTAAGKTQIGAQ